MPPTQYVIMQNLAARFVIMHGKLLIQTNHFGKLYVQFYFTVYTCVLLRVQRYFCDVVNM